MLFLLKIEGERISPIYLFCGDESTCQVQALPTQLTTTNNNTLSVFKACKMHQCNAKMQRCIVKKEAYKRLGEL